MNKTLAVILICLFSLSVAVAAKDNFHTISRNVQPVRHGKLSTSYVVKQTDRVAQCVESAASQRADVKRCFSATNSTVYDPCFNYLQGQLICLNSPWDQNATVVQLNQPMPNNAPATTTVVKTINPWAMELKSGERCVALTGATTGVKGERINYGCTPTVSLLGNPYRLKQNVWAIKRYDSQTQQVSEALIAEMFY
ncbi:MAG TPA: hypothetical protein DIC51_04680 [Coxiellaceae bacterium]|nr:hypothetical protein [Coxiellaceae bacterium]